MKKEILTDELKNDLAEISGKDCPYYIYAFKAEASNKHGEGNPFFYVSDGYKERFKNIQVELLRVPFSGIFQFNSKHTKKEDTAYLLNFVNNNYNYLMEMWFGGSEDANIGENIKTEWSLYPAKEYFTGELSYNLTWFGMGPYLIHFFTPFRNLHCAPFVYVSNGTDHTIKGVFGTELLRFSTNGNLITDTNDLKIKEDDLPKIRRFILANKELIIKAWYGPYTRTSSSVICDELKKVWE